MTTKTATFSVKTAKRVFAGPDRTVEISKGSHGPKRGCHVRFDNGWVVSIQWGPGNYISARDYDFDSEAKDSLDAEVAAWKGEDGSMIEMPDGDTVAGWQSMDHVRAALEAAANDDRDCIAAALTRGASEDS